MARLLAVLTAAIVGLLWNAGVAYAGPAERGNSEQAPGHTKQEASSPAEASEAPDKAKPEPPGHTKQEEATELKSEPPSHAKQAEAAPASAGEAPAEPPGRTKVVSSEADQPQPPSKADFSGHGANVHGDFDSTRDGALTAHGNGGNGMVAAIKGRADNKNPPGQSANDHNRGYECDDNRGVGKGNPAHSGCVTPPPPPPAPQCPHQPDCPVKVVPPTCFDHDDAVCRIPLRAVVVPVVEFVPVAFFQPALPVAVSGQTSIAQPPAASQPAVKAGSLPKTGWDMSGLTLTGFLLILMGTGGLLYHRLVPARASR